MGGKSLNCWTVFFTVVICELPCVSEDCIEKFVLLLLNICKTGPFWLIVNPLNPANKPDLIWVATVAVLRGLSLDVLCEAVTPSTVTE